jgi:hypothetical protein
MGVRAAAICVSCLFFLQAASVHAADTVDESSGVIGFHIRSWHSKPGFENMNPGVYYMNNGIVFGFYRNSYRRNSVYGAYHIQLPIIDGIDAGLSLGLVSGYRKNRLELGKTGIVPLVFPSVAVSFDNKVAMRIGIIPNVFGRNGANVIHVALERRL